MKFSITTFPRVRVAYYRHIGPYGDSQETWDKLASLAAKHHLWKGEASLCIGACHDDPAHVAHDKLRSDASIMVDDSFIATDGAQTQELGGGRYVTATHKGTYAELGTSYEELYIWMLKQGLEPREGPTLEVYRNNPHVTPEDELITDIHAPIK